MTPIELITSDDETLIKDYITTFAPSEYDVTYGHERADVKTILQPWNKAKQNLFEVMNNQLRLTRPICYNINDDELETTYDLLFADTNSPTYKFYKHFIEYVDTYYKPHQYPDDTHFERPQLIRLIASDILIANQLPKVGMYQGTHRTLELAKSHHKIKFQVGDKVIRILSKIVQYEELDADLFEQFRIEHSNILSKKKISGYLTLSIHPIDFMSLSDNNCDWDSCMKWDGCGDYRRGTIAMMNSNCVICAYLEANHPWHPFNDERTIPNKKWRQLFICRDDLICSIKSYPYQNSNLTNEILDWITELMTKQSPDRLYGLTHSFSENNSPLVISDNEQSLSQPILFCCDPMYCDIGNRTEHYYKINQCTTLKLKYDHLINYAGIDMCVWCGNISPHVYFDEEMQLICNACGGSSNYKCQCECCGASIYEDDVYWVGDSCYCEHCIGQYFAYDAMYDDYRDIDEVVEVFLEGNEPLTNDNYPYHRSAELCIEPSRYANILRNEYFTPMGQMIINTGTYRKLKNSITPTGYIYYLNTRDLTEQGLRFFQLYNEIDVRRYNSLHYDQ